MYLFIDGKNETYKLYVKSNLFTCSQRPGSMVVTCLVQSLLEDLSTPTHTKM